MLRLATSLLLLWAASSLADSPPRIPVSALFSNPSLMEPRLSPDGRTLALLRSQGDLQLLMALPLGGGQPVPLARFDDPQMRISWVAWANNERLLVSGETRNRAAVGVRARATRLFGIDRDGGNRSWLGRKWPEYGPLKLQATFQDRVIHWLPADADNVLVEYWPPYDETPGVMRMDVNSGRLVPVQPRSGDIRSWHADRAGVVRAGEGYAGGLYQLWARRDGRSDFAKVLEYEVFADDGPVFADFHDDPGKIHVLRVQDGRRALFEYDIDSRQLGALAFAHPEVDVDAVAWSPGRDPRPVGVRYIVDFPEIGFFADTDRAEHQWLRERIGREIGGSFALDVVSASDDGVQQVIEAASDIQPPVYYFYDRTTKRLQQLFSTRPELDTRQLARTLRVTYTARDGMKIPAYLTRPVGAMAGPLPMVALIHGGPWSRDWIKWDPEVQLLANRGFAVLQMNFRGSTGLGAEHLRAGYREWGQKIQDDISDGVRWAIAEGIADPERIAIAGSSFGGYAALVGLVKTPELYRAGVAYAPVTDIELLLTDDKWYDWGHDWHEQMIGGGADDRERLRASSPLRRVGEIRAPVLLGHGTDDQRIHVRQSQRMTAALRSAGKEVEYLEFPDEVHGLLLEKSRVQWFERVSEFLERVLAPAPAGTGATTGSPADGASGSSGAAQPD